MPRDSRPSVSVIIPNFNGEPFLVDCISSVKNQSYQPLEIIVVDDGSTDNSSTLIAEMFPDIKLITLPSNTGFCHAVNIGIQAATGEYIALLNNDAVADTHWLQHLVDVMTADESLFGCGSKILQQRTVEGLPVIDTTGDTFSIWGIPIQRGRDEIDRGQYDLRCEVFSICAGAAIYRKSYLERVGMFEEVFFAYIDDLDLCFRARHRGLKVWYCPEAIVWHRIGGSSRHSGQGFITYHTTRNMVLLWVRNLPTPLWIKYVVPFVFGQMLLLVRSRMFGLWRIHLKALAAAIKLTPSMMQTRKLILNNSKLSNHEIDRWLVKQLNMRRALRRMWKRLTQPQNRHTASVYEVPHTGN